MSWAVMRTRSPDFRTLPSTTWRTPSSSPILSGLTVTPLYENDELRAGTNRPEIFDRSVMMSSVMPSLKYSCSASPLMLTNGKTTTDGVSWRRPDVEVDTWPAPFVIRPEAHRQTRIGRAMFFTRWSPASSNGISILPRICS